MTYTYPVEEYGKRLLEYKELEKLSFKPEDGRDFVIGKLEERSAKKREISSVLDTMISEYVERFERDPGSLGAEDAQELEALFSSLRDPQTGRDADTAVMLRIADVLKEYYKREGRFHDYLRQLKECVTLDRIFIYNHNSTSFPSPYISECVGLSETFDGMPEEDKALFFEIYYWVFLDHEDDAIPEGAPHPVDRLLAADDFLRGRLGDKYGEYTAAPEFAGTARNSLSEILEHYLWCARNHRQADTERIRPKLERYADVLRSVVEKKMPQTTALKLSMQSTLMHADYRLGRLSLSELLDKLTRMQAEVNEGESPLIRATRLGKLNYHYLLFLYRFSGFDKKTVVELSQQRIKEAFPKILKITRETENASFNTYLMFFILGASLTSRFEEFSNLLLEMTVYSDKALYIHTEMVKELSLVLFDHMIETDPDVFDGVAGRDAEYIRTHKQEMRELLSECCMFHDIGKFFMLDIVENSKRRLTDAEFSVIRTHPASFEEFGRDWMEQDEKLQCIRDCAWTHHLWHDGTQGYPKTSHTKNRPFSDILAIADSIDAATDYIGRPYHSRKTLDQLIDEIRGQAGTRYGPDAAAALSAPGVRDRLLYLTTEGRKDVNYRIYAFNKI